MSEMKLSCPHCGQHIACDESWAGRQIECPACKGPMNIPAVSAASTVVPPAPKRPPNAPPPPPLNHPPASASGGRATSGLAIASMVSSLFICLAPLSSIAGIVCGHLARRDLRRNPALRGSGFATTGLVVGYLFTVLGIASTVIFLLTPNHLIRSPDATRSRSIPTRTKPSPVKTEPSPPPSPSSPAPKVKRPGRLNPSNAAAKPTPPANPATGKIGPAEFTCEDATLQGGWLRLRQGKGFISDTEIALVLFSSNEDLEGKSIEIQPGGAGMNQKPLHIHLKWKEGNASKAKAITSGFTLKLQFGKFENGVVRGQVTLEAPAPNPVSVQGDFAAAIQ